MISFIILFTSAWNTCFSALSLINFTSATLIPSNLIASSSLSTTSLSVLLPSLLDPRSASTVSVSSSPSSASSALQTVEKLNNNTLSVNQCNHPILTMLIINNKQSSFTYPLE